MNTSLADPFTMLPVELLVEIAGNVTDTFLFICLLFEGGDSMISCSYHVASDLLVVSKSDILALRSTSRRWRHVVADLISWFASTSRNILHNPSISLILGRKRLKQDGQGNGR